MPDYQFLCSSFTGMVKADSRFFVDITLNLDGAGNYSLFSEAYVIEDGKRTVVGDDTGLGLVLTMNAGGTYTENADGTVTTSKASHALFEMQTDTYSAQMKGAAGMAVNGNDADGVYDSGNEPAVLDFVPETVWTLGDDGVIVTWAAPNAGTDVLPTDGLTVASDDEATSFIFFADGTYCFSFASYGIEDKGTYTYADGLLTVTNANGDEVTADGDPLKFHYVSAVNEQLTGDYTVNAAELSALSGSGTPAADGLTVTSDDGGTSFTFYADGTYCFAFASYGIEDKGTYTYADGLLTVTNANGDEMTADGDPLKFHYVSAVNEQLTGDYTVNTAELSALSGSGTPAADGLTVTSDDGGTSFTFYADGTYCFAFASYGIEDKGTYTYADGVLTVTNTNGTEVTADGDPLKFRYVSAVNEQLAGDYTVSAADLNGLLGGGDPAVDGLIVTSDDRATTFTFKPDGTYCFTFDAYGIEDTGTYTYEGGTLTITNANGGVVTAQGDPLKFHYVATVSDQLTGDFTVPAADLQQ